MTFEIGLVLLLLVGAIALFATEKVSVDIITWLALLPLLFFRILTPGEAFGGFSSEIIIILASIFVISGALKETGVLDWVGSVMRGLARAGSPRFLLTMMSVVGGTSAFMNNTTVTALFTPLVSGLALRDKVSPSKLLLPVAYASILGGTCTLIGTSTNVAVSGYIERSGMPPLSMFEMTPIGLIILFTGMAYMMLIGQRMLPDHKDASLTDDYSIREYLSEIVICANSPLIGQPVLDSDLAILNFRVLKIIRGEEQIFPNDLTMLEEGDVVLVTGKVEDLMKVKKIEGIGILADFRLEDRDLQGDKIRIAEILMTPQSGVVGRTLIEADFRRHFGVTVLAVNRQGRSLRQKIGEVRLQVGDVLLAQGEESRFEVLGERFGMPILQEVGQLLLNPRKGVIVLAAFLAAVVAGSFGWVPLSVGFVTAALVAVLSGGISSERAYQFIDWRLLILIGGMTAFGVAFEKTGAAKFLADIIVSTCQPLGVTGILAGFFILTIILTQPMSNAAAALVVLPVAIEAAALLHVDPRTFAIGIMLAASVSFIAPFEPSCVLVYGPGKYRFMDFVKTGLGLTLVLIVVVLIFLPVFWPLHATAQ